MNSVQRKVAIAILSEREYQDHKWGTIYEHPHELGAWIALMEAHLYKAKAAWAGSGDETKAKEELRKVLAIGFACAEQHGIEARSAYALSKPSARGKW